MKAIILAGGKGTRLAELTKEIPKPMIPVADKPILEHQILLLKKYGISEVIILINYLKDSITKYFGNGEKYGIKISYYEEPEPLGTVGGIKEIEELLEDDFLVLYGDIMINMNLQRFINFHKDKKSQCTLVLHPNDHPYDSDLVEIKDDAEIVAFHAKPHQEGVYYRNLVNAGAYIMSPEILKHLVKGQKADFGKDIFPKLYNKMRFYGYNTTEYLKDMGTPDRLKKVTHDYETGKIERSSYDYKQRAIFLDRDGVLNEDHDLIHKAEDYILYDFTANAIKKINKSDYQSIVVTNQSVVARNLCTIEELEYIHKKLDSELGKEGAKLDAIYYCPHHPDKGYPEENIKYKVECDCRKPKAGMLLKAADDFNTDLRLSYMIGDSESDILCAKLAGVCSVGVMSGKGLKKSKTRPDYFFPNLKEAVDFIIDDPLKKYAEEVYNIYKIKSVKGPFVISIAGNARSGKSTLSTYLKRFFENNGKKIFTIELDDWLLTKPEREKAEDVFARFQIQKISTDIPEILKKKKIIAPGYSHHPDKIRDKIEYNYNDEEIVIIEGIVALSATELVKIADLKIYKEIKDEDLKKKFTDLYLWKGMQINEIIQLFESRVKDEYSLIKAYKSMADLVIE